jgi:steroid 5-alpha reductase family enzyme
MTGEMLRASAWGLALMLAMMTILWTVQLRLRNAAVVDVGWAAGLGLLALLYAAIGGAPLPRRLLLAALAGLWAFRLAWHLYRDRVANGTPEEGRYVYLRNHWGANASHYFLYFFLGQGALNVVLAAPFLITAFSTGVGHDPSHAAGLPSPWEWASAGLWLLAVCGESLADAQLKAFKADPASKGKTCRRGLWSISRHPNYFCEWLIWCAYAWLASAAVLAGSAEAASGFAEAAATAGFAGAATSPGSAIPLALLGWISPAIILFLLLKVSGIPPTEKQALRSRGAEYARYQAEVSAFFPWFPRRAERKSP